MKDFIIAGHHILSGKVGMSCFFHIDLQVTTIFTGYMRNITAIFASQIAIKT